MFLPRPVYTHPLLQARHHSDLSETAVSIYLRITDDLESHATKSAVSLLESGKRRHAKAIINQSGLFVYSASRCFNSWVPHSCLTNKQQLAE